MSGQVVKLALSDESSVNEEKEKKWAWHHIRRCDTFDVTRGTFIPKYDDFFFLDS